ncbi:MAG: aquaporin, partial [Flavobacteriales bacterium]|nr:aquaporin [Flavobacteriales bacterium]
VNPARSLSQAVFAGGEYLTQVWLFWVAPIAGAVLAAAIYRVFQVRRTPAGFNT